MIGDFLSSVLRGVGVTISVLTNRVFIIVIVAFFVVQPLSWLQSMNDLRFTSFFGMISMMFCVIVIVIRYGASQGPFVNKHELEAVRPSPSMIQTFSTLCFAFGCQQNVPIIQGEIFEKSARNMNFVALISVFIVGIFYMIAGIFGYMTFTGSLITEELSGNVLNMYADRDWLVFVARIASLITVIFCCPMNSLPARIAAYNIFDAIKHLVTDKKSSSNNTTDVEMSDASQPSTSESTEDDQPTTHTASDEDSDDETENSPPQPAQPQNEAQPQSWGDKKFLCLRRKTWISCIGGTVMVFFAALLAIFLNRVNFVFDFLGSTAGVAVAFLIPSMMYLRIIRLPRQYVNANRSPNTTRPEGLEDFRRRNEKIMHASVGCTCGVFLAWLIFGLGILFGIFSLVMAIIFDTSIANHVNF